MMIYLYVFSRNSVSVLEFCNYLQLQIIYFLTVFSYCTFFESIFIFPKVGKPLENYLNNQNLCVTETSKGKNQIQCSHT
jgi:hypothetical protein